LNRRHNKDSAVVPSPKPIPQVALPFECWGIDFIQNFQTKKSKNRHIITVIDYATRWIVAVPEMSAEVVVKFLYEEILMNYGAPFEILTDRGKAFLSEALSTFEQLRGIRHFASTPYHPQTNRMMERMHAMIGHAITTLSNATPERWDEYLAQTVFAIRVRTHAVTKKSPFNLLYGVEPRLPGDSNPPPEAMIPLDEFERQELNQEITIRELETLGQDRAASYLRSVSQADKISKRFNDKIGQLEHFFDVGDMVKLNHHSKNKFEFSWKGPYHIVGLGHPGTYFLMKPDGQCLDSTVNQRDLASILTWVPRGVGRG
jgi:transposase InsO family protein